MAEDGLLQSFCLKYIKHIQLKTNLKLETQSAVNT